MKLLATILLIGLLSVLSFAQIPQKIEGTRIQDFAQILSPEQEAQLQAKTDQLKASKDIELGIILTNSTDGVAPVDYTTTIGRQFGIGSAEGEHRGIVFLLAINDRQCFIQPSRHISGTYTDGEMASICRSMRPELRAQDYNGALIKGTDKLIALSTGVDQQQMQGIASDTQPATSSGGGGGILLLVLLVGGVVVGLIVVVVVLIGRRNERLERERQEAEAQRRMEEERVRREAQERQRKIELQRQELARIEHERWLKTPEGIAETKRLEAERLAAEKTRLEREKREREEREKKARDYAIWAATPAGIAAIAAEKALVLKRQKEAEQRAKDLAAKRKKEQEEEAEKKRKQKRESSESSVSVFSTFESSSRSSSDSGTSFGGFGGGSDFGGGGGGDSW